MFETDAEIKAFALNSWANEIETGERGLSVNDCIERKLSKKIKLLTEEQKKLVARIRLLAEAESKN